MHVQQLFTLCSNTRQSRKPRDHVRINTTGFDPVELSRLELSHDDRTIQTGLELVVSKQGFEFELVVSNDQYTRNFFC
jgi:hypothetical protein